MDSTRRFKAIQELLGHSEIKTTMRYAHLAPSDLQKAVSALSRVASAPVAQAKPRAPRRKGTREAQALPGQERNTG